MGIGRIRLASVSLDTEPAKLGEGEMRPRAQGMAQVWMALGLLIAGTVPVGAADPEIDHLLQSPVGNDWVTNGGNLTNHRYSTLKKIDTTNVKQLKGAWM